MVKKSIREIAEELAELDPVSDAIYNLRGEILCDLKSEGFLPVEAEGPDNQALIDAVIRRLLDLV